MKHILLGASLLFSSVSYGASGESLYNSNCSRCHGSLASSTKKGASAARIERAVNRVPAMVRSGLNKLTPDEINAISEALQ